MRPVFYILLSLCCLTNCKNRTIPLPSSPIAVFEAPFDTAAHIRQYELLQEKIKTKKADFRGNPIAAKQYFFDVLNDSIFYYWMETGWDFNGHTDTPRKGDIACGYFVTTTLRDMGVELQRYKLAQQAASVIVEKLCTPNSIQRYGSLEKLEAYLAQQAEQEIFILGLDYHVGFVVRDAGLNYFVHSDYIGRSGVKRELLRESAAIGASASYMVGNLSGNVGLLGAWVD